jgi:acetyl-CoA carboxylase carboxyltransferase component
MGGEAAAKTLMQIQVATLKAKGEVIDPEREKEILKEIVDKYDAQTSSYYAAARLWVDEIIDPVETRKVISEGINAANHSQDNKEFKMGVFQV